MYGFMSLKQGIDPENPPKREQEEGTSKNMRTVGGAEAAIVLRQLSKIKEKADSTEE
jgi:hypothetical protein